jgi:hypothetical protein
MVLRALAGDDRGADLDRWWDAGAPTVLRCVRRTFFG